MALALALAAPAGAAVPPALSFEDAPEPTSPGAYDGSVEPRAPNSFQSYDFVIAPGQSVGKFVVDIQWQELDDDYDMHVYKVDNPGAAPNEVPGPLVGRSAGVGGEGTSETVIYSQLTPLEATTYRVFVDNWAATEPPGTPNWRGSVLFEEYKPLNERPVAALAGPSSAKAGESLTLDASGSRDVDGTSLRFAWDFDENGSFETDGGATPTISRVLPIGRHIVSVRVMDEAGAAGFASKRVSISQGQAAQDCRLDRASARKARASRRGIVRLKLFCPDAQAFRGVLRLETARRVRTRGRSKRAALGSGRFSFKPGDRLRPVDVKLSRRGLATLRRLGGTRVVATASLKLASGATSKSGFRFLLAPPRR